MVYIVLGMHRSGTSLVASILHEMGVNMGESCDWKAPDNPNGFYEDREIVFFNEKILKYAGGSWDNPPDKNKIRELKDNKDLSDKIKSIIQTRNDRHTLWGWKDPRTILTFNLYKAYLPDYRFICVYRDLYTIAESLHIRNKMTLSSAMNLAIQYYAIMTTHTKFREPFNLHISYHELIRDYQQLVRFSEFLNLPINKKIIDLIQK